MLIILPISKSIIILDSIIALKNNIYYKDRHCCGLVVVEYHFLNMVFVHYCLFSLGQEYITAIYFKGERKHKICVYFEKMHWKIVPAFLSL